MAKTSRTGRGPKARGAAGLSHVEPGPEGHRSRMVDVGKKVSETRTALARAQVRFPEGLRDVAWSGGGPKGPIAEVARCAGLMAAKRTSDLIPMCHPLGLELVEVRIEPREGDLLVVHCLARTTAKTGVEMEALTGAAVTALAIYDMTKALDKGIRIECVELVEKTGGKSGGWRAAETPQA